MSCINLKCTCTVFVFVVLAITANTQNYQVENYYNLIIQNAINYLDQKQVKQDFAPLRYKGEWGCMIKNTKSIFMLGRKGEQFYDSNCFVTAGIHNILAEVYLNDPVYPQIPGILDLAIENIHGYKSKQTFNFWHKLDVPDNLKNNYTEKHQIKRRRSNHYNYNSHYISCIFNIYDDADDTAAAFRALNLYEKVNQIEKSPGSRFSKPDSIGWIFSRFRDINRGRGNLYNLWKGHGSNTGAFLTWFGKERLSTILLPNMMSPNLPLGLNDIDCVVNANILLALTEYDELNTPGTGSSIKWILKMIEERECHTCGNYYPTSYSLHYSFSKAILKGLPVPQAVCEKILHELIDKQNAQGYWTDKIEDNDLQCTLFAVNALMNMDMQKAKQNLLHVQKAIDYICSRVIVEGGANYWKGGTFFSVGSLGRKSQLWISDEYTTALALEAIVNYKMRYLQEDLLVQQ